MAAGNKNAGQQQPEENSGAGLPGFPEQGKMFNLSDFKGLNTQSPRMAIDDQELSWCENFFPIDKGNLRTLYGKGAAIYTATGGKTIIWHDFYNIGSTQYAFVCLSDGSAVQVNVVTHAITTISAAAGTFYNGTAFPDVTQWGSQYLLIVSSTSANGYYIWDGSLLYTSGSLSPLVTINNGGAGYTVAPTVSFTGGSGTGAAGTAILTSGSVTSVNITNPGSGYLVTDKPQIVFTGAATAGIVTSANIVNGGTGYTSAPTVTFSGGGGTAAAGTAVLLAGSVSSITITNGGSGYTSAPTIAFSGGAGSGAVATANVTNVASATVTIMPFGISGTGIETFLSRVWVINGTKLYNTDPSRVAAFNTTTTSTDAFLKTRYVAIKQSNSFLYLIGDSSVNYISNVNTSGSPVITTFSNQNVDPQVGTPWRDTVIPFGRDILLANTNGIYVMFGGAAEKVSKKLNGIFATATLPLSGVTNIPSSAIHTIYGIKVYLFLVTIIDVFTGEPTAKMLMWDGEKWFIGSQELNLTFISTQEVSSNLQPYGTDGNTLFPIFSQPSATLLKKAQGKLWPGDSYLIDKQLLRVYSEGFDNVGNGYSINLNVDTENGTTASSLVATGGLLNFINNSGGVIQFQNRFNQNINFTVPGIGIEGADIDSIYGKMLGFSFTSTSTDFTITNMSILYKNYHFYG